MIGLGLHLRNNPVQVYVSLFRSYVQGERSVQPKSPTATSLFNPYCPVHPVYYFCSAMAALLSLRPNTIHPLSLSVSVYLAAV